MDRKFVSYSLLFLAGTSVVAFSGCKKGSEDPFLSFKSRTKRLSGKWLESKILTKGFDTATLNGLNMPEMVFEEDGDMNFDLKLNLNYNGQNVVYDMFIKGKWEFNSDKDVLTFKDMVDGSGDPFEIKISYDIIGLSNKELHIDGDWTAGNEKYDVDWTATKK